MKISDTGIIKNDIELYIKEKRSNITIKYGNFCRINHLAPLDVILQILDSCVGAALVYGSETWGILIIKYIETIYRHGLKVALSIRESSKSTNNEIVYI